MASVYGPAPTSVWVEAPVTLPPLIVTFGSGFGVSVRLYGPAVPPVFLTVRRYTTWKLPLVSGALADTNVLNGMITGGTLPQSFVVIVMLFVP